MENSAHEQIKAWLAKDGRKASWLAAQVGVTRPMMSKWLKGGVVPLAIYRHKISELTGLAVADRCAWEKKE